MTPWFCLSIPFFFPALSRSSLSLGHEVGSLRHTTNVLPLHSVDLFSTIIQRFPLPFLYTNVSPFRCNIIIMKVLSACLLLLASAHAFVVPPQHQTRAFVGEAPFSSALSMSDETDSAGALVPIKEETVEFTAGVLGGAVGLLLGGPWLAAIGAAIANYASKVDGEIAEVTQGVSTTSLQVFNYLAKIDKKYELLTKAKNSLQSSLDKLKQQGNVDPETIEKVETALASTKAKIEEINDEYDLVGAGMTALGVVGDLVEKAVKKAGELNEEYQLSDKALASLNTAVSKAKDATKE